MSEIDDPLRPKNIISVLICSAIFWIIAALIFCNGCEASDWSRDWDKTATAGQVLVTGALMADWGQTLWATRHYKMERIDGKYTRYQETNPMLGKTPSRGRVNTYFSLVTVGHGLISYALPKTVKIGSWDVPARNIWQAVWFGIEVNQVYRNYKIGCGWRF